MSVLEYREQRRAIKEGFEARGETIGEWAKVNGFSPGAVYAFLDGRLAGTRGTGHQIAVALGLKPGAQATAEQSPDFHDLRIAGDLPAPPPELSPDDIRGIRLRSNASQAYFAAVLGASTGAVTQWEQGLRAPSGPSLRLLQLIELFGLHQISAAIQERSLASDPAPAEQREDPTS